MSIKQFLNWRFLFTIVFFAIIYEALNKVRSWYYYPEQPIEINFETLLLIAVNLINLLIIACTAFYLIKWLNNNIDWSLKTAFLRIVIEIAIFAIISNSWLFVFNETYCYLKTGQFFLREKDIIFLCVSGTFINFFIIPIVELSIISHEKLEADINAKQLLLENSKFKYEVLKNQINPHFLFNSLSVLNSLITINPNGAKDFTTKFSNVLRHVLDFRFKDRIPLHEEKIFLEQYIFLLKTRFGNALNIELSFPDKFLNKNILPMVLQLLIENAIKHNEISDINPMQINIIATNDGVSVSNTIQLKSSIPSWGIGLDYIKTRYSSFGQTINVINDHNTFNVFVPYI